MKYTEEFSEQIFNALPHVNYIAVNKDLRVIWHVEKPQLIMNNGIWHSPAATGFLGFTADVDWRSSLMKKRWFPVYAEIVFLPEIFEVDLYVEYTWGARPDTELLLIERGLLYRTKEEAVERAINMIKNKPED